MDIKEFRTKEYIKTPRGWFVVVSCTMDDLQKMGYTMHHYSDDRKYVIVANSALSKAVAVANEELL